MLEILRRNKGSLFVKIILGGIALMFVLYFGFSSQQTLPPQGPTAPAAQVNGENIPFGTYQNELEERFNQQRDLYKSLNISVPAELKEQLQADILQALIREKLFAQEAKKLGMRIPDSAIADAVRNSPIFKQDGVFDQQKYLSTYQKRYTEIYGVDFEDRVRESLLAQAYSDFIKKVSVPSELQIQDFINLQQVEVKTKQIEIPLAGNPPKNPEDSKKIIAQWIALKMDRQDTKEFLQSHSLQETEENKNLLDLQLSLQNPTLANSVVRCLIGLQNDQVCEQPFEGNGKILAFQLIEKKTTPLDAEKKDNFRRQLQQVQANAAAQEIEKKLIASSKIKVFLTKN